MGTLALRVRGATGLYIVSRVVQYLHEIPMLFNIYNFPNCGLEPTNDHWLVVPVVRQLMIAVYIL